MKFEKTLKIRNKIFSDADIRALWNFVANQVKTDLKGTAEISVVNDDETVSSQCDDIFSTENYLRKNIKRLEFRYISKDSNSRLTVIIEYATWPDIFSGNYICIQGGTSDWVELCAARVHHLLTNVSTTSLPVRLYSKSCLLITMILFIIALVVLWIDFIVPAIRTLQPTPVVKAMLSLAVTLVVLLISSIWFWFVGRMLSFHPIVSIDVNGMMCARNRKICKSVKWFLCSVVLPLLLGWISTRFPSWCGWSIK